MTRLIKTREAAKILGLKSPKYLRSMLADVYRKDGPKLYSQSRLSHYPLNYWFRQGRDWVIREKDLERQLKRA